MARPLDLPWPFDTERLRLRPILEADLEPTWAYWRLPEVTRWLPAAPADLDAHARRILDPGRTPHTLVVEHEGGVVGELMLRVDDAWAQAEVVEAAREQHAEVGYVMHPDAGGRGLATEAVRALVAIALDPTGLGVQRVSAELFSENLASARLLERVGLRRESQVRGDALHRDLGWCDSTGFGLTAAEWTTPPAALGRWAGTTG